MSEETDNECAAIHDKFEFNITNKYENDTFISGINLLRFIQFCGIALTQLLLQAGEVKSVIKKSLTCMFTDNAGKSTATLLSKNFSLGDGNILRVGSSKGIF